MALFPATSNSNIKIKEAESSEVTITGNGVMTVTLAVPSITGYTPKLGIYKGFYIPLSQSYATVISYVISAEIVSSNYSLYLYNFTGTSRTGVAKANIIYTKD